MERSTAVEERARAPLNEHVRVHLIHTFGSARFDVWLGKDGMVEHSADDVAHEGIESPSTKPVDPTRRADSKTSIPPPEPRSNTVSPG
jgi:hypothetical protein